MKSSRHVDMMIFTWWVTKTDQKTRRKIADKAYNPVFLANNKPSLSLYELRLTLYLLKIALS